MYADKVPPVRMDVGYVSKETGVETVLKDIEHIPVSRFPAGQYRKLYEIASVEVSNCLKFKNIRFLMKLSGTLLLISFL